MVGKIIFVATPLGNLGDVSRRAAETLAAADVVACEDTRQTAKLLAYLGISKPLLIYADHNEKEASERVLAAVVRGETVVFVTDAGTPLVADPGYVVLRRAVEAGVVVDVVPGPSAVQTALVLSALPPYPYAFLGYLPARLTARRRFLEQHAALDMTVVLFVAPHRVTDELRVIRDIWGDREAALARELTKKFQEVIRGPLTTIIREAGRRRLRGEMTLVVRGADANGGSEDGCSRAVRLARDLVAVGVAPARAAAVAAKTFQVLKKYVYAGLTAGGERFAP